MKMELKHQIPFSLLSNLLLHLREIASIQNMHLNEKPPKVKCSHISVRPSPFFSLFSVARPTDPDFRVFKKKSYAEGNDTLFQTNVTLIRNIGNFLPYSFVGSSFFRCYRFSLTTM